MSMIDARNFSLTSEAYDKKISGLGIVSQPKISVDPNSLLIMDRTCQSYFLVF